MNLINCYFVLLTDVHRLEHLSDHIHQLTAPHLHNPESQSNSRHQSWIIDQWCLLMICQHYLLALIVSIVDN